jgi:hypothetical protein
MNKLIIIGNGFDLAHGLPTSYKDFLLWLINDLFKGVSVENPNVETPLFSVIYSGEQPTVDEIPPAKFDDIDEFYKYISKPQDVYPKSKFINGEQTKCTRAISLYFRSLCNYILNQRWVDVEINYYKNLLNTYSSSNDKVWKIKTVIELNKSIDFIKVKLIDYLNTHDYINKYNEGFAELFNAFLEPEENKNEYEKTFQDVINAHDIELAKIQSNVQILNFNYTPTIENYLKQGMLKLSINGVDQESMKFSEAYPYLVQLNYIHGTINDDKSRIVFGYGDETDKHYKELEDKNENCWLDHMKSFSYLKTSNYKYLFDFLSEGDFEVHVMGHSLGISDRLLFNHIFEHDNFQKVQLYYYEKPNGTNDFYERTQELSRHFKDDAKHKMRLKVVPFNESQPLPQLK